MKVRLTIEYEEDVNGDCTCTLLQEVDPPFQISAVMIMGILEAAKLDVGISDDA